MIQNRINEKCYKYICINSTLSIEKTDALDIDGNLVYEYNNGISCGKVIEVY